MTEQEIQQLRNDAQGDVADYIEALQSRIAEMKTAMQSASALLGDWSDTEEGERHNWERGFIARAGRLLDKALEQTK